MAANYLRTQVGTHLLRTATFSKPTQVKVALFTDAGIEVSGGSYARVVYGPSDATWAEVSTGVFQNLSAVTFARPTADWGNVKTVVLYDQSGNEFGRGDLENAFAIPNGAEPPVFAAGTITVTVL